MVSEGTVKSLWTGRLEQMKLSEIQHCKFNLGTPGIAIVSLLHWCYWGNRETDRLRLTVTGVMLSYSILLWRTILPGRIAMRTFMRSLCNHVNCQTKWLSVLSWVWNKQYLQWQLHNTVDKRDVKQKCYCDRSRNDNYWN